MAALGLQAIVAPVIAVHLLQPPLPPAASLSAILATSANAIAALPASHHALPLLAVGDATAARARQAGFRDVRSAASDAAALADLASASLPPRNTAPGARMLLASGAGQGHKLAEDLRRRGFPVEHHAVYAATIADRLPPAATTALQNGELQAALFFSADSARAFMRLFGQIDPATLRHVDALAIAPGAADALAPLPWRRIRVASRPNQDELLALLS